MAWLVVDGWVDDVNKDAGLSSTGSGQGWPDWKIWGEAGRKSKAGETRPWKI